MKIAVKILKWIGIFILSVLTGAVTAISYLAYRCWPLALFAGGILYPVGYTVVYWERLLDREPASVAICALPLIVWFYYVKKSGRTKRNQSFNETPPMSADEKYHLHRYHITNMVACIFAAILMIQHIIRYPAKNGTILSTPEVFTVIFWIMTMILVMYFFCSIWKWILIVGNDSTTKRKLRRSPNLIGHRGHMIRDGQCTKCHLPEDHILHRERFSGAICHG